MTTTFYICAAVGWLVTLVVAYALGHRYGRIDGIAEHKDFCRAVEAAKKGEAK